jgi:hypothetical protein
MRYYDFKKAKRIISRNKKEITTAQIGMGEDFYYTGVTVYVDGEFLVDLNTVDTLAGINGSDWATPILKLEYKDGKYKNIVIEKQLTN